MIDLVELQQQLTAGVQQFEDGEIILMPEKMQAHSLERFQPEPTRQRGAFETSDMESWKAYVAHRKDTARVFVDEDAMTAGAVLNFHDGGRAAWQDDVAELRMLPSKPFQSVLDMVPAGAAVVTQLALLDWMDDWSVYLSTHRAGGSVQPLPEARKAIADLTVEAVRKNRSNVDQHFARERTAAERISIGDQVPRTIRLTCSPYRGLKARDVCLGIRPAEHGGSAAVELRIEGRGALLEAIGLEFAGLMSDIDGLDVYRGRYQSRMPVKQG